jgi:hypothetical protein
MVEIAKRWHGNTAEKTWKGVTVTPRQKQPGEQNKGILKLVKERKKKEAVKRYHDRKRVIQAYKELYPDSDRNLKRTSTKELQDLILQTMTG